MKIKTVSELILDYLKKRKGFCFGGTIEREVSTFHKPATISRGLRFLAEDNLIYKEYRNVGRTRVVVYKWKKIQWKNHK